MGIEWYDMIAKRNGGYMNNAIYTVEGLSGEDVFEGRLIRMLSNFDSVLDAGCGHGVFALKMAQYAKCIIGFDNSSEMLKIAEEALKEIGHIDNVSFVCANTKAEFPFEDKQFDLIYNRRGPTSIIKHSRVLRSGGIIFGIHSASLEKVKTLLETNGFIDIDIEVFDQAVTYFPNENEFAKFISAIPGNLDYTLLENRSELERMIEENQINGRLGMKEWRYIWKAKKL